jgi:hypothetical protein
MSKIFKVLNFTAGHGIFKNFRNSNSITNLGRINNLFYGANFKNFSQEKDKKSKSKEDSDNSEVKLIQNTKSLEELDIIVPKDLQPLYSFGTLGHLPLYENPKILGNFTVFLPAPKLNLLIFSTYTYFSYGTIMFQPSLFVTLYVLNKLMMGNFGKITQVLLLSLEKNCEKLYVRTLLAEYRLDLAETKFNKTAIKVGNTNYYEIKNKNLKFSLFISSSGVLLNKELLPTLLNGDYAKVNIVEA